jgi:membrane protease YdiL (CAAX protease family)
MDASWLTDRPAIFKITLFLVFWLILWLPVGIPLARHYQWNPRHSVTPTQKLPLVASLYAIAPLVIWGVIWLEKSSLAAHGLALDAHLARSLLLGLVLATLGLGVVFALEGLLGWVTWKPENLDRALSLCLPLLLLGLWVGVTEEMIFRGIFLDQLHRDYPVWLSAIFSSLLFALLHLIWERRATLPQLPGLWLMGMVLAGARAIDGDSLGLAWGLHAGWVWGLALLDSAELLTETDRGSPWLKGFQNHPLAGLAGILCLLGTGISLLLLPQ